MAEKGLDTLTAEQQAVTFEKSRGYVEKVIPLLEDASPEVEGMVLQMLVARYGVRLGHTHEVVLGVLKANIPMLMAMIQKAYEDTVAEEASGRREQ